MTASSSWVLPSRSPCRADLSRCGDRLMLSMPPATIRSASPPRIESAAALIASRPEAHTLLIVVAEALTAVRPRAQPVGGRLPDASLDDVADDDVFNAARIDAGPLDRCPHGHGA